MIVICEECGTKYQIDPSRIQAERVKTRCSACGNTIIINKPEDISQSSPNSQPEQEKIAADQLSSSSGSGSEYKSPEITEKETKPQKKGLRLKTKIFILFFFIPVILFIGAGSLYIIQLQNLS
ncbi:MAG: zinc-ribbon domain-containing protein, partial [Desulfobacteraceae bacterium]|nr:zinc-ribbon domain-containing protein [Desulfobacteraceae bacterium]